MDFKERYQFDPAKDLIGKGGFSKVYKAFDRIRQKIVALKFYYGSISDKYDIISEINRMEDLIHPNLIRYYDADILASVNSIGEKEMIQVGIMEYADGGDISKIFGLKDANMYRNVILDVLNGLSFLHNNGIVHRDIKPKNILLVNNPDRITAKICDFGIAKRIGEPDHSASSQILGSVEYMAPEQFNPAKFGINNQISTNVDLWSIGIIIFELLTNQTPFGNRSTGLTNEQILSNILFNEIQDNIPTLPEPFKEVVNRCLIRQAMDRVSHADELIAILEGRPAVSLSLPEKDLLGKTETIEKESDLVKKVEVYNTAQVPRENNGNKPLFLSKTIPSTPGKDTLVFKPIQVTEKERVREKKPKIANSFISRYPLLKVKVTKLSDKALRDAEQAKLFFEQKKYPQSFSLLEPLLQTGELDTASKFFLGYMYYNGKCGGAHDSELGKELMDTAKTENRSLVMDLMLKFVLEGYKKI